jgi:hypothetical protein
MRVILLLSYGLVIVAASYLIYDRSRPHRFTDEQRSLIVCDDGKSHLSSEIGPKAAAPLLSVPRTVPPDTLPADFFEKDHIARILCSYGRAFVPTGLATATMPDGGQVTGVPVPDPWTVMSVKPALSPSQFAALIKAKYPQYRDIPDDELSRKVLAKYPQYRSWVVLTPSKPPQESQSNLPAGYVLDPPQASLPPGYTLDSPSQNAPSSPQEATNDVDAFMAKRRSRMPRENQKFTNIRPIADAPIQIDLATALGIDPDLMVRYQRKSKGDPSVDHFMASLGATSAGFDFTDLHDYRIEARYRTDGSWAHTASYLFMAWLAIHLAFVAFRGAVLYVVVGSFLRAPGPRGWLVL